MTPAAHRATRLALALALALAPAAAAAPTARAAAPEAALDRAARCLRAVDATCALTAADRALATLPGEDGGSLRREALTLRAQALALLDRKDASRDAFTRARAAWPGWRPAPDADPRVSAAWDAARRAAVAAALPDALDPGPPPPLPDPPREALLPPPVLYAPPALTALAALTDAPQATPRLHLGLGVGAALVTGAAARRFSPGLEASVDLGVDLGDPDPAQVGVSLWFDLTLALFSVDSALPREPGSPGGLAAASLTAGAALRLPVSAEVALVAAAAVGYGTFGLDRAFDHGGFALRGLAGVRWQLEDRLALRLDAAPLAIVAPGLAPAGHLAVMLRGETRF